MAQGFVRTTIAIDGLFDDWAGPGADPANVIADQAGAEDPDNPPQGDRDIVHQIATYDDQYLYVYYRRSTSVNRGVEFFAYIDTDNDNRCASGDPVVYWGFNGDAYQTAQSSTGIFRYAAANASAGDTLTPNGVDMPGTSNGNLPATSLLGASNGIEYECRVSWTDLGLAPGSPVRIHFAAGQNNQLPGGITDNGGNIWTTLQRGVDVAPDNTSGASADTTVTYTHKVTNTGNAAETVSLSATSSLGWVAWVSRTATGSAVTSVTLSRGASATVVVSVRVPAGAASGTQDLTTLTGRLTSDASIVDMARDTTIIGAVTISPDHTASSAASTTVRYLHTVRNNGSSDQTITLTASSSAGWESRIALADATGTAIGSVRLGAGESTDVIVELAVPSTAALGAQDVTLVRAAFESDPATWCEARDVTTVREGLTVTPDRAAPGGAGMTVSYDHVVCNSWPETRTISVSATSSLGWNVAVYASDGVTRITSVTVGPAGATSAIIVRVSVPAGMGSLTDTTTVTVTSGTATDSAVDLTTVSRLATYSDAVYGSPATQFAASSTVYARGMGLTGYTSVRFRWVDASGTIVYTSPLVGVDAFGLASSQYSLASTATIGSWTLILLDRLDVEITRSDFTVTLSAQITSLYATDAPTVGATVSVGATLTNTSSVDIAGSSVSYVIWWDTDADGVFDAGDSYIDGAGAPASYSGTGTVATHVTPGIDVTAGATWSDPSWSVPNTQFPYRGNYNITAVWMTSGGTVLDTKTTQFYSIPVLGWPLTMLLAGAGGCWLWRREPARARRRSR